MIKLNYDKRFDVLYTHLSDASNSYGDEDDYGNVIHRDFESDEVTALTIFDFMQKCENNKPTIKEDNHAQKNQLHRQR